MSAKMLVGDDMMLTEALEPAITFSVVRVHVSRALERWPVREQLSNREYLHREAERLQEHGVASEIRPHVVTRRDGSKALGIALFRV